MTTPEIAAKIALIPKLYEAAELLKMHGVLDYSGAEIVRAYLAANSEVKDFINKAAVQSQ